VDIAEDELNFATFALKVRQKFGVSGSLLLRFKDEDNELITMVSDEDLMVAIEEYKVKEFFIFDG
jgi:hypothetical protein